MKTRHCSSCKNQKPKGEFPEIYEKRPHALCTDCCGPVIDEYQRHHQEDVKPPDLLLCPRCGEHNSVTQFFFYRNKKGVVRCYCWDCYSKSQSNKIAKPKRKKTRVGDVTPRVQDGITRYKLYLENVGELNQNDVDKSSKS